MAGLKIIPAIARYKEEISVPLSRFMGIINSDTIMTFREYLDKVINRQPKRFILDFKNVSYINSSGIGELIRLSDSFESFGGSFILTNPTLEIMHLIKLLGLENLLPVLPDSRYAVNLFRKGQFKNATIAIINQRLQERLEEHQKQARPEPLAPLGNYTLLIVPGQDFFSRFLEKRLAGNKGKLKIAKSVAQAQKTIRKAIPDMMIIDDAIADNDELLYTMKADMRTNRTRVIRMMREDADAAKKLEERHVVVKEDEAIQEPFDYNELLALARKEFKKYQRIKRIVNHNTRFNILSSESAMEDVLAMLYTFVELSGLPIDQITTYHLALKEAIDNAYRHGNNKDEKKVISIDFQMNATHIHVTVGDEGPGFDYAYYLDAAKRLSAPQSARERHKEGKTGGLGIIMMKKSCDKLTYAGDGNKVVLTKVISRAKN